MSNDTEQLVSALVDEEVSSHQAHELTDRILQDEQLKNRYSRFTLISDVLQNHASDTIDLNFSRRVSQALQNEPTVLGGFHKPTRLPAIVKQIAGLAMAASVTAITILGLQSYNVPQTTATAKVAIAPQPPAPINNNDWVRVSGVNWKSQQQIESQLNGYLVNHHVYSSGMQGILPYAKIVSYQRETNAGTPVAPAEQNKASDK